MLVPFCEQHMLAGNGSNKIATLLHCTRQGCRLVAFAKTAYMRDMSEPCPQPIADPSSNVYADLLAWSQLFHAMLRKATYACMHT